MTPEQIAFFLEAQRRQLQALERIAEALERMAPQNAPNYQFPLESFKNFDWKAINVKVLQSDAYGPGVLEWKGKQFTRRSPSNKFGEALCYLYQNINITQQQQRTLLTFY